MARCLSPLTPVATRTGRRRTSRRSTAKRSIRFRWSRASLLCSHKGLGWDERGPSMDRLARNLDDLRHIVQTLTDKGVRIEFVKEHLTFTGEDSPMAKLMLSVMGAIHEFDRALIKERQREGITLAKKRGAFRGRKKSLSQAAVAEMRQRIAAGISKAQVAREFGISRETLYQYLRGTEGTP